MILNISEASAHLGFRSRTTLQRLLRDGLLDDYRAGQRGRAVLLETAPAGRPSLRERVQACTQHYSGSPLWERRQRAPAPAPAQEAPDWNAIAEAANAMLVPEHWGPPPWTGMKWSTLRVVLEMAMEAVEGGVGGSRD